MFCLKCGEAIADNSENCPKCEACLTEENTYQAVVYASQRNDDAPIVLSVKKKISKKVLVPLGVMLCCAVAFLIISSIGKENLKKAIVKEWYNTDGSIIKVLEIDDDEIEYRLETGYSWMDTTLGSYDWKVVNRNKIKTNRFGDEFTTFTIELNNDKNVLKVMPAITSTDSSETWFHID